jgi:PBSX family phage portal protein
MFKEEFKRNFGDIYKLTKLVEQSDILKPLLTSYTFNLVGMGTNAKWRQDFIYNEATDVEKKEADKEWDTLNRYYDGLCATENFTNLMVRTIYDREVFGYSFLEVLRDVTTGKVTQIEYCRPADVTIVSDNGEWVAVKRKGRIVSRKFKRYVMRGSVTNTTNHGIAIYFKEFGDPRPMDAYTGEYTDVEKPATELIHFSINDGFSEYGMPRWSGCITQVRGSIASNNVNVEYFMNGRIEPTAMVLTDAELTKGSYDALYNSTGIKNSFGTIVVEAKTIPSTDAEPNQTPHRARVDIKKLTADMKDGLFLEYKDKIAEALLKAFRLPPIYMGGTSDYNRATAQVARETTEEQVFVPDRRIVADVFNNVISEELEFKYCELTFKSPKTSSKDDLAKILDVLIRAGAVSPNMLNNLASEVLGENFNQFPSDIGDLPTRLTDQKYIYGIGVENKANNNDATPTKQTIEQVAKALREGDYDDI